MLVPLAQHWKGGSALVSFKLETDSNILVSKARKALNKYGHKLVIGNILDTRKREVGSLQSFLIRKYNVSTSRCYLSSMMSWRRWSWVRRNWMLGWRLRRKLLQGWSSSFHNYSLGTVGAQVPEIPVPLTKKWKYCLKPGWHECYAHYALLNLVIRWQS